MLTLLENGDLYAPEPLGRTSLLLADSKIGKVGAVNARALRELGVDHEVVDVSGCVVVPGFIDPHQHLLGGSGESGFSSQTPEFFISEIVCFGITSVVGALGVDTTMKTMAGLLAKVKGLKEEGLNAYLWTGGYNVPPSTIMASVREDIMYLDEVIGAGEIAISDLRAMDPAPHDLARLVTDCYVGGMLAGKAKRAHFHVGDRETRLQPLRDLLEGYHVQPEWLYMTHVERSKELMREAIELAQRGSAVDIDVVEGDLLEWLRFYRDNDGPPEQLTVSSDAAINSPRVLLEQIRECVQEGGLPLEEVLPLVTSNTARILGLERKGRLEFGRMADVVVMDAETLEIVHVISRGRWMVRDGKELARERFLEESNRRIELVGEKD
ncbi:MAG: amidohydrolase family protein [Gemmatimonadetes bacterium]|nr:amidohydrolase family protein [Gemmatimonadota bacterium]